MEVGAGSAAVNIPEHFLQQVLSHPGIQIDIFQPGCLIFRNQNLMKFLHFVLQEGNLILRTLLGELHVRNLGHTELNDYGFRLAAPP